MFSAEDIIKGVWDAVEKHQFVLALECLEQIRGFPNIDALINVFDCDGTILHRAIEESLEIKENSEMVEHPGLEPLVKALIEFGADLSLKNSATGNTPLHLATNYKNYPLSVLILEYLKNDPEKMHAVLSLENEDGERVLQCAVKSEFPEDFIRELLVAGASPDARNNEGEIALFNAIATNSQSLTWLLLECVGFYPVVVVDEDIDNDRVGWGVGHFIAYYGADAVFQFFARNPGIFFTKGANGELPMHLILENNVEGENYVKVFQWLLELVPQSIDIFDDGGETPLMIFLRREHLDPIYVELLFSPKVMRHIEPAQRAFYMDVLSQHPSNQDGRYGLILDDLEAAIAAESSLAILHSFRRLGADSEVGSAVAERAVEYTQPPRRQFFVSM